MAINPQRDLGGMLFAGGFILLGAWGLYDAREMSDLGAIFPRTICIVMIVLSVLYVVFAMLRLKPAKESHEKPSTLRRVLLLAVLAGWIALMPVIGFVSSSFIGFLVLAAVANYDSWTPFRLMVYPISGACVVAGFYALFAYALKVPLPTGLLL